MVAQAGGDFKNDRRDLGPRLEEMRSRGQPGIYRQVREAGVAPRERLARAREALKEAEVRVKKKGRPRKDGQRPWEVEGVSRTVWYRRKKGGGE